MLLTSLALAACSAAEDPLSNPFTADWYYKDLGEGMMALEIREDPLLKDAALKSKAAAIREDAVQKSQEIAAKIAQGKQGPLMPSAEEVTGRALLLDGMLYLSPETNIRPGTELRVYLTTLGDPRDAAGSGATAGFPDESAVDLGPVQTPYGASQYAVPASAAAYRAVVLYDKALNRIHAFAQLF